MKPQSEARTRPTLPRAHDTGHGGLPALGAGGCQDAHFRVRSPGHRELFSQGRTTRKRQLNPKPSDSQHRTSGPPCWENKTKTNKQKDPVFLTVCQVVCAQSGDPECPFSSRPCFPRVPLRGWDPCGLARKMGATGGASSENTGIAGECFKKKGKVHPGSGSVGKKRGWRAGTRAGPGGGGVGPGCSPRLV